MITGSLEAELDSEVRRFKNCAFADNTKKAYRTHRNSYINFCKRLGCSPVPASSTTLCRYAAYLAKTLKYNSIKQYMNIIRLIHLEWGLPNPLEHDFSLTCTLRGIRRNLGDTVNRKHPITPDMLRTILSKLDVRLSVDATVWAICLCMFFGLLRKSNVMPDNFEAAKHLRRRDVMFFPWGVTLLFRWSKVNQFKSRVFEVPLSRMKDSIFCPVQAIFNSLRHSATASPDGPAFVYMLNGKLTAMTSAVFLSRIRACLEKSGLTSSEISTHSYRRGGATFCYALGFSADSIRMLGDWRSDCYQRYIDNDLKTRLQLVKIMQSSVV